MAEQGLSHMQLRCRRHPQPECPPPSTSLSLTDNQRVFLPDTMSEDHTHSQLHPGRVPIKRLQPENQG